MLPCLKFGGDRIGLLFFFTDFSSPLPAPGVVLDTPSEGPDSLFVQIVTVFVQIVTKNT